MFPNPIYRELSGPLKYSLQGLMLLILLIMPAAQAASFGTRVSIGGIASDLALDERRGLLYVANFTASQIDVISLRTMRVERSMNVARQPNAIALSRDQRWLVVTHFGAVDPQNGATSFNAVTVIDLDSNSRREFSTAAAPLGVAFGSNDLAFIVTTADFLWLDPWTGQVRTLGSIKDIKTDVLPTEAPTLPAQITKAAAAASGDGQFIYAVVEKLLFRCDVRTGSLEILGWTAQPDLGPRTISVSDDGSYYSVGWWIVDGGLGIIRASLDDPLGDLGLGTHVIDSRRGVVYAQVPSKKTDPPELRVLAADNLQVLERLNLPENLNGKSVLNNARDTMYSVSESGVLVLPVGSLNTFPRVRSEQSAVVFRNTSCTSKLLTGSFTLSDPGGNGTPFRLIPPKGVSLSRTEGVTPAVIDVTVDPAAYAARGTEAAQIQIEAPGAVNVTEPVRILVNNRDPDQRGTVVAIPGKLVDLLADPLRDRLYVLRQDTNEVLVLNAGNYRQVGTLRTGARPMQMAITADNRYLLVANDHSQLASVFDLDTLQQDRPVAFPGGHYPRSIGVSGNAILAVSRVTGGDAPAMIDRIDMRTRTATTLASLGIYKNSVHVDSVMASAPNGSSVFVAMPDGNVMLYDANKDTFTVARKLSTPLSGSLAASNYDRFAVDRYILNSSLVPVATLDARGKSSGMILMEQGGFWTNGSGVSGAASVSRLDLSRGVTMLPTSLTEAPLADDGKFMRTLAALRDRGALVSLSMSGLTVLPWNYDAAFAPPRIERVVNAADGTAAVAPGGLITIFGQDLSPFDVTALDPTLADAVPEACLTINGFAMPVIFASATRINAQLPMSADGTTTLLLRTPGGTSDSYRLQVTPTAPAVFRSGTAGPDVNLPVIIRATNNDLVTLSNPIHPGDEIVLYGTGLGRTSPEIPAGTPAPYEPLARTTAMPRLRLGGVDLPVTYSGLTPGQIGVYQINAIVPRNVPTGFDIPLAVEQGGRTTTFAVRVVR